MYLHLMQLMRFLMASNSAFLQHFCFPGLPQRHIVAKRSTRFDERLQNYDIRFKQSIVIICLMYDSLMTFPIVLEHFPSRSMLTCLDNSISVYHQIARSGFCFLLCHYSHCLPVSHVKIDLEIQLVSTAKKKKMGI